MATKLLPINTSANKLSDVEPGAGVTLQADRLPSTVPMTLADLDSGMQQFTSMISWNVAASMGFMFVNANMNASSQVYVQDFIIHKNVEKDGQRVVYGVGTRIAVAVTSASASANISSLPFIAASTSFGFSKASASFATPGLNSAKILDLFPTTSSITLETHIEYANAASQIRKLIYDGATQVTPQILWVTADTPDQPDYEAAAAKAWALQQIKQHHNIYDSVKQHGVVTPHFEDVVRQVYADVAGITDNDGQLPDDVAAARAWQFLAGCSVSR